MHSAGIAVEWSRASSPLFPERSFVAASSFCGEERTSKHPRFPEFQAQMQAPAKTRSYSAARSGLASDSRFGSWLDLYFFCNQRFKIDIWLVSNVLASRGERRVSSDYSNESNERKPGSLAPADQGGSRGGHAGVAGGTPARISATASATHRCSNTSSRTRWKASRIF